jgi:hypothetical protein
VEEAGTSDFSNLIEAMEEESILDVHIREKYRHRFDVDGNPIYYYVIAGIKNEDIPNHMVKQFA